MKFTLATFFLSTATAALACPVCDTANGIAVREGIFNDSFLATFVEVIAPFPVIAILFLVIDRYLLE